MQEWAWQKKGLSFQQEFHFKSIDDRVSGGTQNLFGGYAQTGWFPSDRWSQISDKLEVALRGAYVNSDSQDNLENLEFTVGANWFFNGHRNKLTTDMSYVEAQDEREKGSEYRFQVQWDLSI